MTEHIKKLKIFGNTFLERHLQIIHNLPLPHQPLLSIYSRQSISKLNKTSQKTLSHSPIQQTYRQHGTPLSSTDYMNVISSIASLKCKNFLHTYRPKIPKSCLPICVQTFKLSSNNEKDGAPNICL